MEGTETSIVILDLDGYITYLSTEACHILGFMPEFFTNKSVSINTLVHRDQVHIVYSCLADLLSQKYETKVFNLKAITNFGSYISVRAQIYLNDKDRPTNFFMNLCVDDNHLLFEQEDFVCQLSDQGFFLVVSPQCLMILGWKPYELLCTSFPNYLDEESRLPFYNCFKGVLDSNQGAEIIVHFRHKEKGFQQFALSLGSVKTQDSYIVVCTFKALRKVDESNTTIIPLNDPMEESNFDMDSKTEDLNRSSSSLSLRSTDSSPTLQMANLDLSRRRFSGSDEHLEHGQRASLKKKASSNGTGKVKLGARKSLEGTADTDGSDKKKKLTGKSVYRPSKRTDLICEFCSATESPEWRRGPAGTNNRLCNACGIKYAKKEKQLKEQKGSPLDDADRQKLYESLLSDHRRQRSSPLV